MGTHHAHAKSTAIGGLTIEFSDGGMCVCGSLEGEPYDDIDGRGWRREFRRNDGATASEYCLFVCVNVYGRQCRVQLARLRRTSTSAAVVPFTSPSTWTTFPDEPEAPLMLRGPVEFEVAAVASRRARCTSTESAFLG